MKYKVLSNLKMGDGTYQAGNVIDIAETEETKSLVADKVLEVFSRESEAPAPAPKAPEEEAPVPKKKVRKKKK